MNEPSLASAAAFRPCFDIGAQRLDCGREPHAATHRAAEERATWPLLDYSQCEPTEDQQAINLWLERAELDGGEVLHIGTGNSSVARLLAGRARVTSVTVAEGEWEHGRSLGIADYQVHLLNKHGLEFAERFRDRRFNCVLDNNLASFACCQRHLERYFETLAGLLSERGFVLTHWLGMQWTLDLGVDDVEPVWRLDAGKLRAIASAYGLTVERDGELFFLRRTGAAAS